MRNILLFFCLLVFPFFCRGMYGPSLEELEIILHQGRAELEEINQGTWLPPQGYMDHTSKRVVEVAHVERLPFLKKREKRLLDNIEALEQRLLANIEERRKLLEWAELHPRYPQCPPAEPVIEENDALKLVTLSGALIALLWYAWMSYVRLSEELNNTPVENT